jgi:hypothetical protein
VNGQPKSFFIPDLDRFTLFIDHTMSVSRETGETSSKNAIDMDGRLVDAAGNEMHPCQFYHNLKLECPHYVHVGAVGLTDIVPLGALLLSAGVTSLDEQSVVAYAREIAGHHHPNTTYVTPFPQCLFVTSCAGTAPRACCLSSTSSTGANLVLFSSQASFV